MINIEKINEIKPEHIDLIQELISELTESQDASKKLDSKKILTDLTQYKDQFTFLLAKNENGTILGTITFTETFSFFAHGVYGIINELYIKPSYRSHGIGKILLHEVVKTAREKGWVRVDVTAPLGKKWNKSLNFYLKNGFQHTGPKLKYII